MGVRVLIIPVGYSSFIGLTTLILTAPQETENVGPQEDVSTEPTLWGLRTGWDDYIMALFHNHYLR